MSILIIFKQRIPLKLNVSDRNGVLVIKLEIQMPDCTNIKCFTRYCNLH